MKYDFDVEIPRQGTHSIKWQYLVGDGEREQWDKTDYAKYGNDRVLPMWVADMDFQCPQPCIDAIVERAKHGIFGYSMATEDYFDAVIDWMKDRYDWTIDRQSIAIMPGVVPALNTMIQAFLKPGENVIIQRPVYYPFSMVIEQNGGQVVSNTLLFENGRYHMDFADLEAKAADPNTTMMILCSPHNPTGRVWTREELQQVADICMKNDVLLISDEIHCDLTYDNVKFVAMHTLSPEVEKATISCTAPSKTFNLAGLSTSHIIIPDADMRETFEAAVMKNTIGGQNLFGLAAVEAAYKEGGDWLNQVMEYIQANYRFMEDYISQNIPEIDIVRPDATYLVWFDCRRLGLDHMALKDLMLNKAKVFFDEGYIFGPEGEGFERINIACPRSILEEALVRMKDNIDALRQSAAE